MIVEENNVITVSYELRDGGPMGALLERMDDKYPFHFLFGTAKLLPDFEENLRAKNSGDEFEFILPPEKAYGPVEEGNIIDIPIDAFKVAGNLQENMLIVGNYVAVTDDGGLTHNGKILSFTDTKVKIDFNHVMAGKTLHFKGVVLNIRPASIDELVRKHYIEEDGIHRSGFQEDGLW